VRQASAYGDPPSWWITVNLTGTPPTSSPAPRRPWMPSSSRARWAAS